MTTEANRMGDEQMAALLEMWAQCYPIDGDTARAMAARIRELRAALEAAPEPDPGHIVHSPHHEIRYQNWWDTIRAPALGGTK